MCLLNSSRSTRLWTTCRFRPFSYFPKFTTNGRQAISITKNKAVAQISHMHLFGMSQWTFFRIRPTNYDASCKDPDGINNAPHSLAPQCPVAQTNKTIRSRFSALSTVPFGSITVAQTWNVHSSVGLRYFSASGILPAIVLFMTKPECLSLTKTTKHSGPCTISEVRWKGGGTLSRKTNKHLSTIVIQLCTSVWNQKQVHLRRRWGTRHDVPCELSGWSAHKCCTCSTSSTTESKGTSETNVCYSLVLCAHIRFHPSFNSGYAHSRRILSTHDKTNQQEKGQHFRPKARKGRVSVPEPSLISLSSSLLTPSIT